MNGFGAVSGFQIFADIFKKIGRQVVAWILDVYSERRFAAGGFFGRGDFPLFLHAVEHQVATGERERGIIQGRKFWPVDHAGQKGCLLKFQIRDGLAKIELGSASEAIVAVRQINLVRIHGENLWLRIATLDLQSEKNFLHFAAETSITAVEEKIPGQLHGDGAGACGDVMLQNVSKGGAGDAWEIDAPVIFEVLVLDGGHGVVKHPGNLLVGHEDAALKREAADHLAIVGINFGNYRGAIGFERAAFRQVAGINEEQAAGRAQRDGAQQQEGQRDAVNQFEAAQAQGDRGQTYHR